jgi:hypothetical protein
MHQQIMHLLNPTNPEASFFLFFFCLRVHPISFLNLTHGEAGREGPVVAGGADLERRGLADLPHKLCVPGSKSTG